MFGAVVIIFSLMLAILGYLVMPDSTPNANEQMLEIAAKKPGFSINVLKVRKNAKLEKRNFLYKMLFGEQNPFRLYPVYDHSLIGEKLKVELYTGDQPNDGEIKIIELVDVCFALSVKNPGIETAKDMVTYNDINEQDQEVSIDHLEKMIDGHLVRKTYLLGTDRFGRDMLSRMIGGTRLSLAVGFVAVFISLIIGISLGAIAGFFRGIIDEVVMWFVTVVWSIPLLLLVIAITLALGKGFWQVFLAVGLAMWVDVARITRGQILSLREKEYVEACRALGFSGFRTIFRHILPNIMGPVIVISAANFATAILIEAGLSFLGVGAQPPQPSWGRMIKDHYGYIIMDEAYLAIIPGAAIFLMVLSFTLVGNGIRDALDVRAEK